jgi:hypothetical protein
LIRRGIPEVYAELAAQATTTSLARIGSSKYLITGAFCGGETDLGWEFWAGVHAEVEKGPNFNGMGDLE